MYEDIIVVLKGKNKYLVKLIQEIDEMLYIDSNSTIVKGRRRIRVLIKL